MVEGRTTLRLALTGLSLATGVALLIAPATAQAGFFDQLFGGSPAPTQPTYDYSQPLPQSTSPEPFVVERHRRPAKKVVVDDQPVLQQPTDLMHDRTLRPGDAVMMKTGIHIYTGRDGFSHRKTEFAPLDDARIVRPAARIALAALDVSRNDPLTKAIKPDTLASGRSASVGSPVVEGVKFTDQRGRTIRYIGP